MYTRMEQQGHKSNRMLGTTTVEQVADAVSRAVTDDVAEIICNSRPIRPLAAISAIAPGLGARLIESSGTNEIFRGLASDRES